MITREANAHWNGTLKEGDGRLRSKTLDLPYTFASRFGDGEEVSPEELIGNAHAGCYSMALALELGKAGYPPTSVQTTARVYFDAEALAIPKIELRTEAAVEGIDADAFRKIAEAAKDGCPVSKLLAGAEIELVEAQLVTSEVA